MLEQQQTPLCDRGAALASSEQFLTVAVNMITLRLPCELLHSAIALDPNFEGLKRRPSCNELDVACPWRRLNAPYHRG